MFSSCPSFCIISWVGLPSLVVLVFSARRNQGLDNLNPFDPEIEATFRDNTKKLKKRKDANPRREHWSQSRHHPLREFAMPALSAILSSVVKPLLKLTIFNSSQHLSNCPNQTNLRPSPTTTLLLSWRNVTQSRWMEFLLMLSNWVYSPFHWMIKPSCDSWTQMSIHSPHAMVSEAFLCKYSHLGKSLSS